MNKIFITGDIHGDPSRFSINSFSEQKELDKNDYVIIAGDFGLIWSQDPNNKNEKYWLDWLDNKPFTTLYIDGNHKNFDRLNNFPISEWNGGKVHKIKESVIHLMRGEVYNLANHKFFTFGGAPSHDITGLATPEELKEDYSAGILERQDPDFKKKQKEIKKRYLTYRINHEDWWKEELPNNLEKQNALKNLQKHNFNVDYIITHDAPASNAVLLGYYNSANDLTKFLESIKQRCNYKHWYFGHYHENKRVTHKDTCLYGQIIRIF